MLRRAPKGRTHYLSMAVTRDNADYNRLNLTAHLSLLCAVCETDPMIPESALLFKRKITSRTHREVGALTKLQDLLVEPVFRYRTQKAHESLVLSLSDFLEMVFSPIKSSLLALFNPSIYHRGTFPCMAAEAWYLTQSTCAPLLHL